jgi:hypothetical protein
MISPLFCKSAQKIFWNVNCITLLLNTMWVGLNVGTSSPLNDMDDIVGKLCKIRLKELVIYETLAGSRGHYANLDDDHIAFVIKEGMYEGDVLYYIVTPHHIGWLEKMFLEPIE